MDWFLARRIWLARSDRSRQWLLVASIAGNLALLGYFKYGSFLLDNFVLAAKSIGLTYRPPALDILLPIGISFYTFASLSYTIDVYRREIEGDCSLTDYALFVSFFPHLVAGPIVRAKYLLPQIHAPRSASLRQIGWGLALVVFGLFCKIVLADNIFAPVVDTVYSAPEHFGAIDTWVAVFSFSGQIYYDFSGYSLCAIGLALCFGFDFPDNFRYPYAADSFSDFWRRWHISLSTWLRDYLYIPMGGNRGGRQVAQRNLVLTMLIGGLWHGASWMFVLWGGLHGAYLAVERMFRPPPGTRAPEYGSSRRIFTAISIFLVVTLTWIPFRSPSVAVAENVLLGLFKYQMPPKLGPIAIAMCIFATVATTWWQLSLRDRSLEARFAELGTTLQTFALAGCLIGIFLCSGGDSRAFIYFQF